MTQNRITFSQRNRSLFCVCCVVIISMIVVSCNSQKTQQLDAVDLKRLFDRNCCGWTGGDGVYSIPLSNGKSVFIFGDTYLGEVTEDYSRENTTPAVKNALVILDENGFETIIGPDTGDKPKPYFRTPNPDSSWFWPGHGYESDNQITFFLSEFKATGKGVFGFEWTGTSIAQISSDKLETANPQIVPWDHGSDIHFGMATLTLGEEIYVFGIKAFRLYIAKNQFDLSNNWQYWTGEKWSNSALEANPLNDILISEQFSVFEKEGSFYLISQAFMLGKQIYAYTSESLTEGWSKPNELYTTPESIEDSTLFTYNALAHPQYGNDSLVISYCINSTDFLSIYKDVRRYRPQFIQVPWEIIKPIEKN